MDLKKLNSVAGILVGYEPKTEVCSQNYRLCGLVVRVSGYRSRGPGFDSRPYQIFWEVGGTGTETTQPREDNWEATWMKK
jgi:hypothetical protein